ncbi:hypothetical protein K469DRAFT_720423 [Zopfia rhizophila CBS 207.26]|uniref:Thioesterase domain-containing protein n=1 Tax=Zopfia rhizophila CBS 207.26 TaxID=1314779 RepID=A0A6A6EL20_9PEZI|nr:hypothetical protein K469DRAFT_720423 [Zopfia rhizophila CBS 207.26]
MAESIERFNQVRWCADMIKDPAWTPTNTASRVPKPSSEDSFFAETLGTNRTIRYLLTLRPTKLADEDPEIREVRTFMDLGDGLNGYPDICHGGFVATILDEILGVLITLNMEKRIKNARMGGPHSEPVPLYTAYLTTNYKKPVPTPGVILCTAKFVKQERNKTYVRGTIEDGQGTVYASGDGMFVEPRSKI